MGDPWPVAGKGVFHLKCSFFHVTGIESLELPAPFGPRNRGQFSADKDVAMISVKIIAARFIEERFTVANLIRNGNTRFGNFSVFYFMPLGSRAIQVRFW